MLNKSESVLPISTAVTEKNPYRLNLTLSPDVKRELEVLKKKAHKSTTVEVIRAALALYKLLIEHQLSGGRVIFRHADDSEETLRFL